MHLAQDCIQWRVLVNTVMSLRFHKKSAEFPDRLSDCQILNEESTTWSDSGVLWNRSKSQRTPEKLCGLRRVVVSKSQSTNGPNKQL
jgi:hypothetical protein